MCAPRTHRGGCCLAAGIVGSMIAADSAVSIATFDGPDSLRGWTAVGGSLEHQPYHTLQSAAAHSIS